MKKNFKELKNEELENVSGGKYSSDTYAMMDLSQNDLGAGQVVTNHPLITTWGNRCGGWQKDPKAGNLFNDCFHCKYMKSGGTFGWVSYCKNRSRELDNYK